MIVSSFVNIILGYGRAWGELTSPIVVVPVVCLVGLGLFARGFPLLGNCVEIGLPMLVLLVISQQFANNNSMRNIYVLGVSLFLGLSIPQYFAINTSYDGHGPVRTNAIWFNDIMNTIFSLPATVAITVGTILDNTLEANQVEDRGVPWWKPFQHSKGDVRTEEFYSYPLRLNEYICSPDSSVIFFGVWSHFYRI
ncbi:Nucleobase-ascorbate transporter 3 [Hibiscus syriacus]|uniref:Nucleobase-ascorbate transporter 3 n=1 Tax=Hibiscus syriacus TaxID=106335 RepID=A0A6A3BKB5_HIBSY|nr:Nucleobase-ascorbate transporter 3 [Hibiscus syriacus]